MNKNHLKNALGRRADSKNQDTKALSKSAKALVAFGLASLLPSFACADESIKKIQEVFDSQDRDSQKIKKLDDYSPVVDLRSSSLGRNSDKYIVDGDKYFPFFPDDDLETEIKSLQTPVIINRNMIIGSPNNDHNNGGDRWNVTTGKEATKFSRNITINGDAILNIYAHNYGGFGYRFAIAGKGVAGVDSDGNPIGNLNMPNILWQGGTININFKMGTGGFGGHNNGRGALTVAGEGSSFTITSNLKFDYIDTHNDMGSFQASNVSVVTAMNKGVFKLLGDNTTISINQFPKDAQGNSTDSRNRGLGGFALYAVGQGTIYLNTKEENGEIKANNEKAIVQVTGGISTSAQDNYSLEYRGGNIYAHFTNAESFLKGNVYAGRFDSSDSFSTLKMSFTDGATMTGNIVFSGNAKASTSDILFANGSRLDGKILDLGVGNHKVTFDKTGFAGTIKRVDTNEELKSIGVISKATVKNDKGEVEVNANHGIQISDASYGTSNTIITFKNTDGQTFGNGTDDIVDASYNGIIIGDFDMADGTATMINGGTDGSKGFKGKGKNTLTFDFANNASTTKQANSNFTIGGGNEKSVYTLDRFMTKVITKDETNPSQPTSTALDLTTLDATNNLYSKITKAGINIASDLKGTLQFRRTDIKVGTDDNALFASKANIVGNNNLGPALGASFGNAIWNDANNDGEISADEITKNADGRNYKLSPTAIINPGPNAPTGNPDPNASTGNIGKAGDGVKKTINFIFDGLYTFNGDKQGYTGNIAGGTEDSRYVFANAGFIEQTQVAGSKGALVLFNTAFRGDLGVENKAESITLDFGNQKSGLVGNIVGSGAKNIVFNFTGNTKAEKYTSAVVGSVTGNDTNNQPLKDTFTMVNLKAYSANDTLLDGTGALKGTTIIEALKTAGLTNFDIATQKVKDAYTGKGTDISELSKTNTTIALRGTSLNVTDMGLTNYIYDFAFGSGYDPINGIAVEDSTLSGVIDLSSNVNAGHRVEFRGNSLVDGTTSGITVKDTTKINLSFDDSTATYTEPTTFKIMGLSETNKLTNGSLKISKTNLEGNLFTNGTDVDLNFTEGRTWMMSKSNIDFKGGNSIYDQRKIIIHGDIKPQRTTESPELTLNISDKSNKYRTLDMVNTGATLKLDFGGNSGVDWNNHIFQAFNLRGTSLQVTSDRGDGKNRLQGVVWDDFIGERTNFNLVFAKGTKLETTKTDASGKALSIIDKATGEGNYIAESIADFHGFNAQSGFNMTLIGENSFTDKLFSDRSVYESNSRLDLVNSALTGTQLKNLFNWDGGAKAGATITLQGTSLNDANGLSDINQSKKFTFNMAFIQDNQYGGGYVDEAKYGKSLAITNANGALKDSILKVTESALTLKGGLNFVDATYNILFAGEYSQNLSGANFIEGGSANSTITFRNTTLNAGSGTNSSLRNIKGKVIFDLAHKDESSTIIGDLSDMFFKGDEANKGSGDANTKGSDNEATKGRVYLTKLNAKSSTGSEGSTIFETKKLVFLNGTSTNLETIGSYFSDAEVFGDLSKKDYSDIAKIDTAENSKLSFGAGTIALKGEIDRNQDLVFIGKDSHQFGNADSTKATKLGDSTYSTLTFIDAGKLDITNIKDGKGTINLVGSSNLELGSSNKLSFSNGTSKGEGLTINAKFTGANNLGKGVGITTQDPKIPSDIEGEKGSNADIGDTGDLTKYHLVFDYTDILGEKKDQGFGKYWVYQGKIAELAEGSKIKFKNAGLIFEDQITNIKNTRISLENTEFGGNFRGDYGELDYRGNNVSLAPIEGRGGGNILTSDLKGENLSKKELTFDFTNSPKKKAESTLIQAGYKVALDYQKEKNSKLTFQNTLLLTLGNDTEGSNESTFIKAIANDIGFNIKDAESKAPSTIDPTKSYILSGTELGFQGTGVTAMDTDKSITEGLYSLDLSFDRRADGHRGQSIFNKEIGKSTLVANSITMGEAAQANTNGANAALNLSLAFHDKGSLSGDNTDGLNALKVNLANGARFNLTADSTNGKIGTLILGENLAEGSTASSPFVLAKESSLSIGAGSMSFIGDFTQSDALRASNDLSDPNKLPAAGNIKAHFNGTNQVYGSITGRGDMSVTIEGNALFDYDQVKDLISKNAVADLTINASKATSSNITLAHRSGTVEVIGQTFKPDTTDDSTVYTALNLADAQSHTILEGAFNIGKVDLNFGTDKKKTLELSGDTLLQPEFTRNLSGNSTFKTITLKDVGLAGDITPETKRKLTIIATKDRSEGVNLNVINPDSRITVRLEGLRNGHVKDINFSKMMIRGANLELATSIMSEQFGAKDFIFAKGKGTDTEKDGKLHELTTDDRINESALMLLNDTEKKLYKGWNFEGSMTFIGDASIDKNMDLTKLEIDGAGTTSNFALKFGFFNSIVEKGSVLFDNTSTSGKRIYDIITLRGTTTNDLSVKDGPTNDQFNYSKINAVFVKDSSMTGEYINIDETGLNTTLKQTIKDNNYHITDAGGVFKKLEDPNKETKLKVLQSQAIGNITMAETVTADMRFIGNGSHSFGDATNTLSGGNFKSRFDFDHTSVDLGSIAKAGGNTFVYNSKISGSIAVQGSAPSRSSTTLFFNDGQELSPIAQKYLDYNYASKDTGFKLGINLDLGTAHKMESNNLTGGKLGATGKQTNIILIGKEATGLPSVEAGEGEDKKLSINLGFLPDPTNSGKYAYAIIDGGVVDTNVNKFGSSKVMFVNTDVYGERNFAQVGFINTLKRGNQISSWGGDIDIDQFLIFDFHKGQGYIGDVANNGNKNNNAIYNSSSKSRYIFTNFGRDKLVLSGQNTLKDEINKAFGEVGTINSNVVGYLGLRGVSIEGDINEDTNGVDIVFNSTGNISYIDKFNPSLEHEFAIEKRGFNTIANSSEADITENNPSGYATLGNGGGKVTITGKAHKDIVFIGKDAVRGGFENLTIEDGSDESNYTFHSVGTLSRKFLENVGLYNATNDDEKIAPESRVKATKGNFTFESFKKSAEPTIIIGDINVDANTEKDETGVFPVDKGQLTFRNVIYSGTLSGSLKKDLHFAQGSKGITIKGGSKNSSSKYDFNDVDSIDRLDIDLSYEDKQGNVYYYASEVTGFENGDKSLSGYLRLFTRKGDGANVIDPNAKENYFAFKDNAKWTVTDQSSVMNLTLGNTGNSYNLEVRLPLTQPKGGLAALEVGKLLSSNGRALIWTAVNTQDQSKSKAATIKADTFSGTLFVTAKDKGFKSGRLDTKGANAVVLVEAGDGRGGEIKGNTVKEGLRYSTTTLEHQEEDAEGNWIKVEEGKETQAHQRWVLASFDTQENKELVDETSSVVSNSYRMLLIETNNLNKRMGELRDNDYAQGAWIRVFNGMDSGEGTKNLYTNVQLGYDYAFGVIGAKNYTGGAFSTSIADISGNQYNGKGNTYSIALYNSYIADNGLYVDAIAKYLYMDQRLTPRGQGETKLGNHAYSLGAEVGYRVPIKKTNFFIETQGEIVGGIIQGMKDAKLGTYNSAPAWGELGTTPSLSLRAGIVAGYTLKTQSGFRADFRLGASLVSEFVKGGSIVLKDNVDAPIHSSIKNDNKVVLNLGTNLILTDKWRIYIDAERSFAGSHNTDYQASVGARFSFGKVVKSIPKDEIAPIKLKEEEKKDAQAQIEQEVKKEEVKAEQAPKAEKIEDKKADVKKTEAKKAETKAKKQPAKKQAKKQAKNQPAKKQAKKPTAKKAETKPKNTNKPAPAGEKKGGWGWW